MTFIINVPGAGVMQSMQRLATGWTVGVRIPVGTRHSSKRPDRLRGPHSFILREYRRTFPGILVINQLNEHILVL